MAMSGTGQRGSVSLADRRQRGGAAAIVPHTIVGQLDERAILVVVEVVGLTIVPALEGRRVGRGRGREVDVVDPAPVALRGLVVRADPRLGDRSGVDLLDHELLLRRTDGREVQALRL